MKAPHVSIVIRTRDEERYLGETLRKISLQSLRDHEVVIVDSGSVDRTLDIARAAGVRVISIEPGSFTYGHALNVGAAAARGTFIVNLSAHAIPASESWLQELADAWERAIRQGHRVAGVYGRQLPMADAAPPVLRDYSSCYGPEPRVSASDAFFSNANALLPRELCMRAPFDETLPYCEDLAWMRERLREGYVSVYAPAAAVYHSHNETLRQVFRRSRNEGAGYGLVTGERWSPATALIAWRHELAADWRYFARVRIGWADGAWWRAPAYRLAQALGGLTGRRAAARRAREAPR